MPPDETVRPCVLLVEDEALVAMVAEESLRLMGMDPVCAATAGEALTLLREGLKPALAIVDVGLPDMRGDVLVGRLREQAERLPIILASGYDSADLNRRFADDPRTRVLAKPYSENQLRQAMGELDSTLG